MRLLIGLCGLASAIDVTRLEAQVAAAVAAGAEDHAETQQASTFEHHLESTLSDSDYYGDYEPSPETDILDEEETYSDILSTYDVSTPAPNKRFLFHNKLPKSGSTTMKYIIQTLQKRNNFQMDYISPCLNKNDCLNNPDDGISGEKLLGEHVKEELGSAVEGGQKYVLLKHQYWTNFTKLGIEQPTYINVVRDPITRFSSMYYFNRYGFSSMGSADRLGATRHSWKGDQTDYEQTLDECVQNNKLECTEPQQVLVRYFCGTNGDQCSMKAAGAQMTKWGKGTDWDKVAAATQVAKRHILTNYYAIGLMEDFGSTLKLFEKVLPEFFEGAEEAYASQFVQTKKASSSTAKSYGFSNATRTWLEQGPLRYEVDLYQLVKSLFKRRLEHVGLTSPLF